MGRVDAATVSRRPRAASRPVTTLPHDAPGDLPTSGFPSGRHRVLEPAGALPLDAQRLDPHPDVWDAEARLDLLGVVLSDADLASLVAAYGPDPATRRAALLEACAERGGLPTPLADARLVGQVVATGTRFRQPVALGDTVVTSAPARAFPLWVSVLSDWDGLSRVAPAEGHVIVGDALPLVRVPADQAAEVSAALAAEIGVPGMVSDVVHPGDLVAVIGGTTIAGALAATAAAACGAAEVVALVTTLQDARLVAALGGVRGVIGDARSSGEAATQVVTALGGTADTVIVATDAVEAVTTAVLCAGDGTVLLAHGTRYAAHAAAVASSLGTAPVLRVDRPGVRDAGAATMAVVGSSRTLVELVRWRAGVGPAPAATRPEDA